MEKALQRAFFMELLPLFLIVVLQIFLVGGILFFIVTFSIFARSFKAGAPYVKTPYKYLPTIAEALEVRDGDVVYDLGCGDGRVIFYLAARYPKAQCIGVETSFLLSLGLRYRWYRANKPSNVTFVRADLRSIDLSHATHVFLYLLPRTMAELESKMRTELSHARVVSRAFPFPTIPTPGTVALSKTPGSHGEHLLHIYELTEKALQ